MAFIVNSLGKKYESYQDWITEKLKSSEQNTGDDTFTPDWFYDGLINWIKNKYPLILDGKDIIRPFYPGGDYEKENYENMVVIDNPPFSLFSQITKYYEKNNIKFFLFYQATTAINGSMGKYGIKFLKEQTLKYNNGLAISTCFITNFDRTIEMIDNTGWNPDELNKRHLEKNIFADDEYNFQKFIVALRNGHEPFYLDDFTIEKTNKAGRKVFGSFLKKKNGGNK